MRDDGVQVRVTGYRWEPANHQEGKVGTSALSHGYFSMYYLFKKDIFGCSLSIFNAESYGIISPDQLIDSDEEDNAL